MTLSHFLRDYLYIPLGGNRRGRVLRYINLLLTMLLGGLWHGAAWTFVIWGALHGAYLCINHAFNALVPNVPKWLAHPTRVAGAVLTFLAVVVAWVFFRAERVDWAMRIVNAMADPSNIVFGREEIAASVMVTIYAALVWLAPNTQGLMG
ncbi:D-alanyl-lipoteichoic acid acyltransferase DltB (MBOAT superfamily) [Bradyrhizobium sp. GM5.1]